MTPSERRQEWVSWYKASPSGYRVNALLAVLENDGEKMLGEVLKDLRLTSALELIKALKERE